MRCWPGWRRTTFSFWNSAAVTAQLPKLQPKTGHLSAHGSRPTLRIPAQTVVPSRPSAAQDSPCPLRAAVGLYCSSGAAILFAWRDYMPTFTEASLIAAGTGALLWVVLAAGASARGRTWGGLAGFVGLGGVGFRRCT